MKIRVIELEAGEIPTFYDFDSYREAKEYVDKIVANAKKKKHKVRQDPEYKDGYYIDSNYIYIEEPKSKPFEWDFSHEKTTPTKRSLSNSNTNPKQTTFMPTAKVQIGTKKNGQPVYGTAKVSSIYKPKGTKNGKPAMTVPAQYVTLPANFYIFGRKHNGDGNNRRTYVIGAAKTKNGKNLYCVAQLTYMGGKPAVAENRYKGYSRYNAWSTFNEIPYTDKEVKDAKNNWKKSTSDGSAKAAVSEAISIRRRFAANRAKK